MNDSDFSAEAILNSVVSDTASLTAQDIVSIIEKASESGKAMGDYLIEKIPEMEEQIIDAVDNAMARF